MIPRIKKEKAAVAVVPADHPLPKKCIKKVGAAYYGRAAMIDFPGLDSQCIIVAKDQQTLQATLDNLGIKVLLNPTGVKEIRITEA